MSVATPERPRREVRYGSRLLSFVIGTALACGLAVLLLWHAVLVRIPPGHVGVLYSLLSGGTVTDTVYPEGVAFKLPWNQMYLYKTRLQAYPFKLLAFSAEGMPITVEATTLYRVKPNEVGRLFKAVGLEYVDRVVSPISISAVRRIVALYNSHELYTIGADRLHDELLAFMRSTPEARFIDYAEIPIRTVRLPEQLIVAIQQKLGEQQRAAAYDFRLISQRQEAERLRIEAIGLRNFYSIVQSALTDKLLTWRGIEATVEVAKSPNTKIVIVGGNKDQLPLILGSDITRGPTAAEQPVAPVPGDASPLPDWSKIPSLFGTPLKDTARLGGGTDPVPDFGPQTDIRNRPPAPKSE